MGVFLSSSLLEMGFENLSQIEIVVLIRIAAKADDDNGYDERIGQRVAGGNSYPSYTMLSHYTSLSLSSVKTAVRGLENKGWIRRMRSDRHDKSYQGFGKKTINWQLNLSMLVRKIDAEATIKGKNVDYRSEEARALIAAAEMLHDNDWDTTVTAWSRGYKGKVLPWDGTVKDATPSLWCHTSTATAQPEIVEGFITPEKLL